MLSYCHDHRCGEVFILCLYSAAATNNRIFGFSLYNFSIFSNYLRFQWMLSLEISKYTIFGFLHPSPSWRSTIEVQQWQLRWVSGSSENLWAGRFYISPILGTFECRDNVRENRRYWVNLESAGRSSRAVEQFPPTSHLSNKISAISLLSATAQCINPPRPRFCSQLNRYLSRGNRGDFCFSWIETTFILQEI